MRWIAALSMLAIFGGVPATAQERQAKSFEGTSVTLIAGADGANRYGDWSGGIVYGGQLGHDWQRNRLVFGLEGEVTGSSDTRCGQRYSPGSGGVTNCVSTGRDFYAGGRIGTPIGNTTLLYGKMGYTNVEQQYSSPQFLSGTTDGFRLGTGLEHRLTSGMTLKAEYRYSNYAGSYDRHQAVLGLGFRF